jgi:hypothetical protein
MKIVLVPEVRVKVKRPVWAKARVMGKLNPIDLTR